MKLLAASCVIFVRSSSILGFMSTDLDRLTRHFCRTLLGYTGGAPMAWRSILIVSSIAGIPAASTQKLVIKHGTKRGWLIAQGGGNVALTEKGREISADLTELRERLRRGKFRQDSDGRLSSQKFTI
jgi:hypothetical protein